MTNETSLPTRWPLTRPATTPTSFVAGERVAVQAEAGLCAQVLTVCCWVGYLTSLSGFLLQKPWTMTIGSPALGFRRRLPGEAALLEAAAAPGGHARPQGAGQRGARRGEAAPLQAARDGREQLYPTSCPRTASSTPLGPLLRPLVHHPSKWQPRLARLHGPPAPPPSPPVTLLGTDIPSIPTTLPSSALPASPPITSSLGGGHGLLTGHSLSPHPAPPPPPAVGFLKRRSGQITLPLT